MQARQQLPCSERSVLLSPSARARKSGIKWMHKWQQQATVSLSFLPSHYLVPDAQKTCQTSSGIPAMHTFPLQLVLVLSSCTRRCRHDSGVREGLAESRTGKKRQVGDFRFERVIHHEDGTLSVLQPGTRLLMMDPGFTAG